MSDSLHTSWLDSTQSVYYSITVDPADKYEFLGTLASGLKPERQEYSLVRKEI